MYLGRLLMRLSFTKLDQQALYHCPNKKCTKDFKILGGLINHLESEACGAMHFGKVQAGVERLIRGGRLLE